MEMQIPNLQVVVQVSTIVESQMVLRADELVVVVVYQQQLVSEDLTWQQDQISEAKSLLGLKFQSQQRLESEAKTLCSQEELVKVGKVVQVVSSPDL